MTQAKDFMYDTGRVSTAGKFQVSRRNFFTAEAVSSGLISILANLTYLAPKSADIADGINRDCGGKQFFITQSGWLTVQG